MGRCSISGKPVGLIPSELDILLNLTGQREDMELFDQVMAIGDGVVIEANR